MSGVDGSAEDFWRGTETAKHDFVIGEEAKVPLRNGGWVQFELLLDPPLLAALPGQTGLSLDEILEDAERWSQGAGFIYGVTVDREKQTITRAGEA